MTKILELLSEFPYRKLIFKFLFLHEKENFGKSILYTKKYIFIYTRAHNKLILCMRCAHTHILFFFTRAVQHIIFQAYHADTQNSWESPFHAHDELDLFFAAHRRQSLMPFRPFAVPTVPLQVI